jgi:hypothetical protein
MLEGTVVSFGISSTPVLAGTQQMGGLQRCSFADVYSFAKQAQAIGNPRQISPNKPNLLPRLNIEQVYAPTIGVDSMFDGHAIRSTSLGREEVGGWGGRGCGGWGCVCGRKKRQRTIEPGISMYQPESAAAILNKEMDVQGKANSCLSEQRREN